MKYRVIIIIYLILLFVPVYAAGFEADNLMIDPGVEPIRLKLAPEPGMKLVAAMEPNTVLAPFKHSGKTWPGYLVEYRYVKYIVAVSCGEDSTLPCSRLYVSDYSQTELTVRYVQSADDTFTTPEGLRVGSLYAEAIRSIPAPSRIFTGSGECVRLASGWNACFQKDELALEPATGQYRPGPNARIYRFIK